MNEKMIFLNSCYNFIQYFFNHSFNPHPELSSLCQRLWDADENRLEPGVDYEIDPQGKTRYHSREDRARDPLFTFVKEEVFQRVTFRSKNL